MNPTADRAVALDVAEVAVPVPLRKTFHYRIPQSMRGALTRGSVVRVPFAGRTLTGFVVGLAEKGPVPDLKEIETLEEEELSLPGFILDLADWVSQYYLAPIGEVLRAALPAGLGKKTPGSVPAAGGEASVLELNPDQERALQAVSDALTGRGFRSFLLHGVTGSGKTEVYLRAATQAVEQGRKVLILIPEIALSPQMVSRVEARFGNRVALWHSALTPTRRREVWSRARRGELDVVVGARSAVFTPLPDLGLIIVDEEHEPSYKQDDSPRYHARDVALVRAREARACVVLGSATPSLESYTNAKTGKHGLLELPERVGGRPLVPVEIVSLPDVREKPVSRIFSRDLLREIAAVMSRGEQGILFLNRRGYSTLIQCRECATPVGCRRCDVVMTYHAAADELRCHYCGARRKRPEQCGEEGCGGLVLNYKGVGTEKVEAELRRLFPGGRVLRLDADTARKRGAVEKTLNAFRDGEADLLLGTQMVAKGLDYPRVTLVGVVNADTQLALPDFRSGERTFQLLTQVAGRSGRGDEKGRVIFQTNHPGHPAVVAASRQDYHAFYAEESARRRDGVLYPPHIRLVNLLLDGRDEDQVVAAADLLAEALRPEPAVIEGQVQILGPAPQPITRLKGQHRWHLTLRGPSSRALRAVAEVALDRHAAAKSRVRLIPDVDPLHML